MKILLSVIGVFSSRQMTAMCPYKCRRQLFRASIPNFPVGESDFRQIITSKEYFADNSLYIKEFERMQNHFIFTMKLCLMELMVSSRFKILLSGTRLQQEIQLVASHHTPNTWEHIVQPMLDIGHHLL
jgi:hypothetical protein